jgi:hypothetical protein
MTAMKLWKKGDVAWSAGFDYSGAIDVKSSCVVTAGEVEVCTEVDLPGIGRFRYGRRGQPGEFCRSRREALERLYARQQLQVKLNEDRLEEARGLLKKVGQACRAEAPL